MTQIETEDLNEITTLRRSLATVVSEAGQTALQIRLLESDLEELNGTLKTQSLTFKELLSQEQSLIKRLSEKYGAGQINFETGEFTPEK
jgi:TolA-binding protein